MIIKRFQWEYLDQKKKISVGILRPKKYIYILTYWWEYLDKKILKSEKT